MNPSYVGYEEKQNPTVLASFQNLFYLPPFYLLFHLYNEANKQALSYQDSLQYLQHVELCIRTLQDQGFYHSSLEDIIVDLNQIIQPNLCIIDGRVGIQGWNGPKTRPLNAFIFGRSPVAVDATMARIMGFEPEKIPHLAISSKHGLGTLNPEIKGEKIEDIQLKFKPRGKFLS